MIYKLIAADVLNLPSHDTDASMISSHLFGEEVAYKDNTW